MFLAGAAGCGHGGGATEAQGPAVARIVPVTVANLEHRAVERTVEVIGTLRGWEQVTVGTKRTGRVVKVHHDIGDRVKPGEPLVELDPVDAKLGVQQAESKYLGELVKLGITKQQAEEFVKKYGISEAALDRQGRRRGDRQGARRRPEAGRPRESPATPRRGSVHSPSAARARRRSSRTPKPTVQTAVANYDDAVQAARTVIANADRIQGRPQPGRADA